MSQSPGQYPDPRRVGKGRNQTARGAHKHSTDDLTAGNTKLLDAKNNLADVKDAKKALSNLGGASSKHTHVESDVANLVSDLNGKLSTSSYAAKGDILVGVGNGVVTRLPAGPDGTALVADSTAAVGLRYGPVSGADVDSNIENVNTVAASGAAQTLPDVDVATIHRITLTASCSLTFPTAVAGKSFSLELVQDGTGSRTVTWPGTVKWALAVAPTLSVVAGAKDDFAFVCFDGTNWSGFFAGKGMA